MSWETDSTSATLETLALIVTEGEVVLTAVREDTGWVDNLNGDIIEDSSVCMWFDISNAFDYDRAPLTFIPGQWYVLAFDDSAPLLARYSDSEGPWQVYSEGVLEIVPSFAVPLNDLLDYSEMGLIATELDTMGWDMPNG